MNFARPVFSSRLPLPCFFTGTVGTLGEKSAVSLAVTGFDLSQTGWDTGPFSWDRLGHFGPDAMPRAVLRNVAGGPIRAGELRKRRFLARNLIPLPPLMRAGEMGLILS